MEYFGYFSIIMCKYYLQWILQIQANISGVIYCPKMVTTKMPKIN